MKAYQVSKNPSGLDSLKAIDIDKPSPAQGEVLIKVKANSLNYRDTVILQGGYPRNDNYPTIPLSDMAGEVEAIGEGVSNFKVGDRVAANFMRDWVRGPVTEAALRTSLGGGVQGTLAEYIALPEHALVSIPDSLSYEEAATLPCAAVTAWNGLTADPNLKAGDTLLLLGTGGVSIFGLQLGKAMGLRTIITSSSDDKLAKAKALGADATVNYKNHPEWHEQVLELTDGHGVDHVLEVGGPGTLERSIKSTRVGGTISMIGLLDVPEQQPSMLPLLMNAITVRGIYVGSVEIFESLLRTIEVNKIKPVIDRSFPFDDAHAAYEYFMGKGYLGKVVISHE